MGRLQDEVRRIVDTEGVIARRDHPDLAGAIKSLSRTGELVTLLPGVLCLAGATADLSTRVLALRSREPDAVLTRRVAAQLAFWPELKVTDVTYAVRHERRCVPGFRPERRCIPPDLVLDHDGLRMTTPALTVLDLCDEGTDAIDEALRRGAVRLAELYDTLAMTARRRGNARRLRSLLDSRDEPWSAAERLCHRLLREHGFEHWTTNHPVTLNGQNYFLDVAFPRSKVVVEIDGRVHERREAVFERDRVKQNALVLDGWTVLRFTTRRLEDEPGAVVAEISEALHLSHSWRQAAR